MNRKKCLTAGICGILAGILTAYLRSFSPNSFLSISDIAVYLGFWVFTTGLAVLAASSAGEASVLSGLYLIFMCIAYYVYIDLQTGQFYWTHLIFWGAAAVVCVLYARPLWRAVREPDRTSIFFTGIPLVILLTEAGQLGRNFLLYRTHLLQPVFDLAAAATLLFLFCRTKRNRILTALFAVLLTAFLLFLIWLVNRILLTVNQSL